MTRLCDDLVCGGAAFNHIFLWWSINEWNAAGRTERGIDAI